MRGVVGESVVFKAPVLQQGFLRYGTYDDIARVFQGSIKMYNVKTFKGRVIWDNQTGLFQLTNLTLNDQGNYTVENIDGMKTVTVFHLTVYTRVPKPEVRVSQSLPTVEIHCSLLCSVSNGREVTLSWQREGGTLSHTSNPDLNTTLTLPLETEGLSHSYSCVASNPVSTERTTFNIPKYSIDGKAVPLAPGCPAPLNIEKLVRFAVFGLVTAAVFGFSVWLLRRTSYSRTDARYKMEDQAGDRRASRQSPCAHPGPPASTNVPHSVPLTGHEFEHPGVDPSKI
ncbi:CD48 antigen-like [Lepisosteus oculatus]|uniref:CD48 antigen-like n=1 Tax=Lepisosteus oculatus TaxID=7918 RepID=UPI003712322B